MSTEEITEEPQLSSQTTEESEAPHHASQEIKPANTSSRTIASIVVLLVVIGIAVALAFAMGLFDSGSSEPVATSAVVNSNNTSNGASSTTRTRTPSNCARV